MAKISEILTIEKERSAPSQWNIIHLFKEGGFYRAYEWSAWLVVAVTYNDEVRKQTDDRKPLNVTHKQVKNGDDTFVFVGFPLKSVDKFIPDKMSFTPVSDTQIDVLISLPMPADGADMTFDILNDAFVAWKASYPVQLPKERDRHDAVNPVYAGRLSLTAIMAEILAWPLELKSPLENTAFISEKKQQLAQLL